MCVCVCVCVCVDLNTAKFEINRFRNKDLKLRHDTSGPEVTDYLTF